MPKCPKGLKLIEALAPELTRFKCETKTDWLTMYRAEQKMLAWANSTLNKTLIERMNQWLDKS